MYRRITICSTNYLLTGVDVKVGSKTVGEHDLEEPRVEGHDKVAIVDGWKLTDNQFGDRAKESLAIQQVQVGLRQPVEPQDVFGQVLEQT